MTADAPVTRCAICGLDEPDARLLSRCFDCGSWFHLNPRSDVEGLDCGDAWIGESLGITTYCSTCIDRRQQEALAAEGADAEMARQRGMMQALTPAAMPPMPPAATPPPMPRSGAGGDALPPRSKRSATGRRYRRIEP